MEAGFKMDGDAGRADEPEWSTDDQLSSTLPSVGNVVGSAIQLPHSSFHVPLSSGDVGTVKTDAGTVKPVHIFANNSSIVSAQQQELQDHCSYSIDSSRHDRSIVGVEHQARLAGEVSQYNSGLADSNDHSNYVGCTTNSDASFDVLVRKSGRIVKKERSPSPTTQRLPYVSKPYSTYERWCEDCQTSYVEQCSKHKPEIVADKLVLSRAWASLPPNLQIFRLQEVTAEQPSELGVFAKRALPKRTQFGPFVANHVTNLEELCSHKFLLLVDLECGTQYLDAVDEALCNWMMFVRPAASYAEQNLVAYQYGEDIYFSTIKNIEVRQELKVWYATHYAERLGVSIHPITDSDIKEMNEAKLVWHCYECPQKFRTSAQLQKHLAEHDPSKSSRKESLAGNGAMTSVTSLGVVEQHRTPLWTMDENDIMVEKEGEINIQGVLRPKRKVGRPPKTRATIPDGQNDREQNGENGGMDSRSQATTVTKNVTSNSSDQIFQSWKKKKKNMYLNKMKKYADPIKRSIRVLSKQRTMASLGLCTKSEDLKCANCPLTFDNASVLNIHMLAHTAENLDWTDVVVENGDTTAARDINKASQIGSSGPYITAVACPVCALAFTSRRELIEHASEHATANDAGFTIPSSIPAARQIRKSLSVARPFKCSFCWKGFKVEDGLIKHMLCHADDSMKPLQCTVCSKRLMNNSALSCHMKAHSSKKYYECPICHVRFDQSTVLATHAESHAVNGVFPCPECHRSFVTYKLIRSHMRSFHSQKIYCCPDCSKSFPRQDKLRLHLLRHSNIRDFMCDFCGGQFKRRDKLREHVIRKHGSAWVAGARISAQRYVEDKLTKNTPVANGTVTVQRPQKSANAYAIKDQAAYDYNRYVYKCHTCLLGFKRRGMLVNHLAKRHPEIQLDTVPELNLPIVRAHRDYFCQYCEKIYKSSSKRKVHILKVHPGAELPASARRKEGSTGRSGVGGSGEEYTGNPNPTYSVSVGTISTVPHPCEYCHKQYASKAKLLQHHRKKHVDWPTTKITFQYSSNSASAATNVSDQGTTAAGEVLTMQMSRDNKMGVMRCIDSDGNEIRLIPGGMGEMGEADLFTQAMTELTQSYGEYRLVGGMQGIAAGGSDYQYIINTGIESATTSVPSNEPSKYVQFHPQISTCDSGPSVTVGTDHPSHIVRAMPQELSSTVLQQTSWANF